VLALCFAYTISTKELVHSDAARPTTSQKIITKQKINIGLPVRLEIPKISVNATIYSIGLTSSGSMDIKSNPDQVAWYKYGPRPGEIGSAVVAGHYGWANGKGSVFNDLQTLTNGDEIIVVDDNGNTNSFIVDKSQLYDPNADTTNIFKSSDGRAHLNIITCNGTWESSKQTYSNRLVVYASQK
jgi:LPXTG-site transpeptidase (sortase) family protein